MNAAQTANSPTTSTIRLMLVEDHEYLRNVLVKILDAEPDMQVIHAVSNAETALEIIPEERPDIILMDVNLPGMSGIQATRLITALETGARVIGLSTFEDRGHIEQLYRAGAVLTLSKTESPPAILHAIRQAMQKPAGHST